MDKGCLFVILSKYFLIICFVIFQNSEETVVGRLNSKIRKEDRGLDRKQLRERNREREWRRLLQREEHQQKRESDIAKLLIDHKEELATCTDIVMRELPSKSPPVEKAKSGSLIVNRAKRHMNWCVPFTTRKGTHLAIPNFQKSVKVKKAKFSEMMSFVNKSNLSSSYDHSSSRAEDLNSMTISHDSYDSSSDRNYNSAKATAFTKSGGSGQAELDSFIKCLQSSKKETNNKSSLDSHSSSQSYSSKSLKNPHKKVNGKINSELKSNTEIGQITNVGTDNLQYKISNSEQLYQMNSTFTLPLDRISEVDSNESALLSNDINHHVLREEFPVRRDRSCKEHEDTTSLDTTWTISNDVKKLLHD